MTLGRHLATAGIQVSWSYCRSPKGTTPKWVHSASCRVKCTPGRARLLVGAVTTRHCGGGVANKSATSRSVPGSKTWPEPLQPGCERAHTRPGGTGFPWQACQGFPTRVLCGALIPEPAVRCPCPGSKTTLSSRRWPHGVRVGPGRVIIIQGGRRVPPAARQVEYRHGGHALETGSPWPDGMCAGSSVG